MMNYESRACCICGPVSARSAIQASVPAEALSLTQLTDQWNGFFKDKETGRSFFSYQRCTQCGLLFCPTYFNAEQLKHLYENMPDNTANVDLNALQKTQYGYFKQLLPHIKQLKGDYFEMGPDIGLFTQHVLQQNRFEKIWLAEPNQAVWPQLQTLMQTTPFQLFSDVLAEDPIANDSLGAAVMIHVLDHMLDPVAILEYLYNKMQRGGMLLIVTHDESSLLARILRHGWPAYCLQHPQLFRPQSITNLLEKSGFKLVEIQKTYNHFPVGYLLNHLVWALGLKKKIFPDWMRMQIPLKLGNILTLAIK